MAQSVYLSEDDSHIQAHNYEVNSGESKQPELNVTDKTILKEAEKKYILAYESCTELSVLLPKNYSASTQESASYPGPPSSRVHSSLRAYHSFPLTEKQQQVDQGNCQDFSFDLEKQSGDQGNCSPKYFDMLKAIMSRTLGNKNFLKWVFIVLNVLVEICQATFAQEAAQGNIRRHIYLKLSIVTSTICLVMSVLEILQEVKESEVVWQKRGHCCWFYYVGMEGKLFGRFSLYFGVISSMIQLIINVTEKLFKKDIIKFDYLPLLLAVCYFAAAAIASCQKNSSAIVRCKVHGSNTVVGAYVEGQKCRVFECPQCQMEESTNIL